MEATALVQVTRQNISVSSGAAQLLDQVRPAWKQKSLIERVTKLLPVDPSSACQRLFNAAVRDLREKAVHAGVDVAQEIARVNRLPSITGPDDILENYSTSHLIELVYKMGLLNRAEWRRVRRCYDIRRDLEHEDSHYEATVEDCLYIFKTCIEAVLSREPASALHVTEVKDLVERPDRVATTTDFIHDFSHAPGVRQEQILKYLVSTALDSEKPDLLRQNAVETLRVFEIYAGPSVKIEVTKLIDVPGERGAFSLLHIKVAAAGGLVPYLKQTRVQSYFASLYQKFKDVGYHWDAFEHHRRLLEEFEDVGAISACPDIPLPDFVRWMVLCYLGSPGGRTRFGNVRPVFYSNAAEPIIERLFKTSKTRVRPIIEALREDESVARAVRNEHISRRYEALVDLVT